MRNIWRTLSKHLDVAAILIASMVAIVLSHLGLLPEHHVISFILFLLAIHVLLELVKGEDLRKDMKFVSRHIAAADPEIEIIKPAELLLRTEEFALKNRGEDWWFNPCASMFRSDELFDRLLKSSIENPRTTKIILVMKPEMREVWEKEVQPKVDRCKGRDKVKPPVWSEIEEGIALRMIDSSSEREAKEALLTFWGEPFMMEFQDRGTKGQMPRYVIYTRSHSELIPRLKDIFTKHRLNTNID